MGGMPRPTCWICHAPATVRVVRGTSSELLCERCAAPLTEHDKAVAAAFNARRAALTDTAP